MNLRQGKNNDCQRKKNYISITIIPPNKSFKCFTFRTLGS
uniref:Uncharacterized protein n=1 Tax=Anguilla anguilla TaxID=7936 RepID=A0A0E9RR68_ANGAN